MDISEDSANRLLLSLADVETQPGVQAGWIGALIALGARASRYRGHLKNRQLIIAISVPQRDYAAVLIGCGWVLSSETPKLDQPLEILRNASEGAYLRAVNSHEVVCGNFVSLDERTQPPRVRFAGSDWRVDRIQALTVLRDSGQTIRMPRHRHGSLERMAVDESEWEARLALPAADLAIIGTRAWIENDMEAYLGRGLDESRPSKIGNILMPMLGKEATSYTRLYSAANLDEILPLAPDSMAIILDGNGAAKHLGEMEASVVICVFDRSVSDESISEMVVQMRNTRGEPVSPSADLGWVPPAGVEALAFSVAL